MGKVLCIVMNLPFHVLRGPSLVHLPPINYDHIHGAGPVGQQGGVTGGQLDPLVWEERGYKVCW